MCSIVVPQAMPVKTKCNLYPNKHTVSKIFHENSNLDLVTYWLITSMYSQESHKN